MLSDYHLLFMAMSFCLLIITLYLLFLDEKTKQGIMMAMFLNAINWLLCIIISLGFFGIGLIGYDSGGTPSVTSYADMYPYFAVYMMLQYACVALMFLCVYFWTKKAWDIDKDLYEKQSPKSNW